jgi:fused signal recognition particle receptor
VTVLWIAVGLAVVVLVVPIGVVLRRRALSRAPREQLEPPRVARGTSEPEVSPSVMPDATVGEEPQDVSGPRVDAARPTAPPAEVEEGLETRLRSARSLFERVRALRGRGAVGDAELAQVEEALLRADVGVATTETILAQVRASAAAGLGEAGVPGALRAALVEVLGAAPAPLHRDADDGRVAVWLFVGVNGVGKTTTIGKLAKRCNATAPVLLAAADTFRAAAADQLEVWADRVGCDLVRADEGADPGAVVHDALHRAASRGIDLVLADTAGRLHNKASLLQELAKVRRVADREPGQVTEVLLVLDATTGQNAIAQAREFTEAVGVTGIVLTKLDGTARGGVVLAVQRELGIPVRLVGVGERDDDLVDFDPGAFVDALLGD